MSAKVAPLAAIIVGLLSPCTRKFRPTPSLAADLPLRRVVGGNFRAGVEFSRRRESRVGTKEKATVREYV